jgi:hypothetical protein
MPTKKPAPPEAPAKLIALLTDLLGRAPANPPEYADFNAACEAAAGRIDDLRIAAAEHRKREDHYLEESMLGDLDDLAAMGDAGRAADEATAKADELVKVLAALTRRRDEAKARLDVAQVEAMRKRVATVGGNLIDFGADTDGMVDELVDTIRQLTEPIGELFRLSPREMGMMPQAKNAELVEIVVRRLRAYYGGVRPLPTMEGAMQDVAAVAGRAFDEQHPQPEKAAA